MARLWRSEVKAWDFGTMSIVTQPARAQRGLMNLIDRNSAWSNSTFDN